MNITLVNHEGGIVNVDNRTVIVQGDLNLKKGEAQDAEAEEVRDAFVPKTLKFFDQVYFGQEDKQLKLIKMLEDVSTKIDITNGRSWFCLYAGYRYYKNQLAVAGGYTDFFSDIEALIPGRLEIADDRLVGDERYQKYTILMGREAKLWYMDKKKLPPLNELTFWANRFGGDETRFNQNAPIIIEIYKAFKTL